MLSIFSTILGSPFPIPNMVPKHHQSYGVLEEAMSLHWQRSMSTHKSRGLGFVTASGRCRLWFQGFGVSTMYLSSCKLDCTPHRRNGSIIPQTVLALRGSDGFSRDLWRCAGVRPQSSRARSCRRNRYLVTLTFAPLERNRGSRAQTQKISMGFCQLLFWAAS